MANSKTTIVIVTFNGINIVEKSLESIKRNKHICDVIVLDNNSKDDTANYVKTKYPWIKLIELRENIGFGRANNIGIKIAMEDNADYVLLLNQDAEIMEDTVDTLIKTHVSNIEFGIISPIHLDSYGNIEEGFIKNIDNQFFIELSSDMLMGREIKDIYDVYFVNAAIWLLTRKCIETIGYFNPFFFMYGEDDNYVQRCKYYNIKIGIAPNTFGIHHRKLNDVTKNKLSHRKNRRYVYNNISMLNINEKYYTQLINVLLYNMRMIIVGIKHTSLKEIVLGLSSIGYIIKNTYKYYINRKESRLLCAFKNII